MLARLLQDGVTAQVAKRPIVSGGTTYPRGSVVITRRNNEALWDGMAARLTELATGVPGLKVGRLESGMVDEGPIWARTTWPTFLHPAWPW